MMDLEQAERDWRAVNPFVVGDMLPAYQAWNRLERARVAAYERGECCGCFGIDGECDSRAVQIRRRERMTELGMTARDIERVVRLCERSDEYRDEFNGLREVETDQQKAEAWRIWAERFIQEYGARNDDDINHETIDPRQASNLAAG